jgi:hypothetical protein
MQYGPLDVRPLLRLGALGSSGKQNDWIHWYLAVICRSYNPYPKSVASRERARDYGSGQSTLAGLHPAVLGVVLLFLIVSLVSGEISRALIDFSYS